MTPEQAEKLREPFPASAVGKLPKAGIKLDYVGHAAVTDRLLQVDPEWCWEPVAFDPDGAPLVKFTGKDAVMWIRLTVCGVTRLGVGIAPAASFELEKQLISDAIRNAAMRYGVALDLWSKEDLQDRAGGEAGDLPPTAPPAPPPADLPPVDTMQLVIDAMTAKDLHDELEKRGLESSGTKPELRDRLRAAVAA